MPKLNIPDSPPPLPTGDTSDQSYRPEARITGIVGAAGMTEREVLEEIGRGGRFVMVYYTVSILVLTFRRTFGLRFLKAGESAAGLAWAGTLLTLLTGWWGIPWGPIYSIQSLFHNLGGGKDVTREILEQIVGPEAARTTLGFRRPSAAGGGIWALRLFVLGIPLLFAGMIALAIAGTSRAEATRAKMPGYAAYKAASQQIHSGSGGNTPAARQQAMALAASMADAFKIIKSNKGRSPAPPQLWLQEDRDRVAVLVFVPDWRKFSADGKNSVAEGLWSLAAVELNPDGKKTMLLAIRGLTTWDRAYAGTGISLPARRSDGADEIADQCLGYFAPPSP